jgi:hypothetical protein
MTGHKDEWNFSAEALITQGVLRLILLIANKKPPQWGLSFEPLHDWNLSRNSLR